MPVDPSTPNIPNISAAASAIAKDDVFCCPYPDLKSRKDCQLCKEPICENCHAMLNGKAVCITCHVRIIEELEDEQAGKGALPTAVLAGIAGAIVGGIIWAAVAIGMKLQSGAIAIGVGWLTGQAVVLGAGGKKGAKLQIIAASCALIGLILAKYFILGYYVKGDAGIGGYFSLDVFLESMRFMKSAFSFLDPLFFLIALYFAWRQPRPTEIEVR
jgi:hypothetical protein